MSGKPKSENERSAESPVLKQGPFNLAAISEVRQLPMGRAFVLSGPRGYQLVTPTEPSQLMSLLGALIGKGFTHYTLIDTTAKTATRIETRQTSDVRFHYTLTITMGAQVVDPVQYLQDFSPDVSIFDAFYPELIEDIALELSTCKPEDLADAQRDMRDYATRIKRDQPQPRGVRIQLFAVRLEYGPELALRVQALDRLVMFNKFGESYFAAESAADPAREQRNTEVIRKFRDSQMHDDARRINVVSKGLDLLERTSELTGESIAKLAKEAGLQRALQGVFPTTPAAKRVTSVSVSEITHDPEGDHGPKAEPEDGNGQ